ncbi:MAG: hypothetical protein AAGA55_00360 [Planctomycetota bacterium]
MGDIAVNIWASVIGLFVVAVGSGLIVERYRREMARDELRLKLIDRSEEAAELFASLIPRQLALQRRFWELAEEDYAVRHRLAEADRLDTSSYRRRRERDELQSEWRSQTSYIAAAELIGGRAPSSKEFAVSITSCMDLFTQLDPVDLHGDPERFVADYISTLRSVPESSGAAQILQGVLEAYSQKILEEPEKQSHWRRKLEFWEQIRGEGLPVNADAGDSETFSGGDEVERWKKRAIFELRIASDWLETYGRWSREEAERALEKAAAEEAEAAGHASEDDAEQGNSDAEHGGSEAANKASNSSEETNSVELARLVALRACRRSLEHTVDILYSETMGVIGESIKERVYEILDKENPVSEDTPSG